MHLGLIPEHFTIFLFVRYYNFRNGSDITDGDIVAIVVMLTFTAGILILDACFILAKGQHSRKFVRLSEFGKNRFENNN